MNRKLVPTHKYKTTILFYDDDNSFLNFLKKHLISDKYDFHYVDNLNDFQKTIAKSSIIQKELPNIISKLDNELNDFAYHEAFNFDLSKFKEMRHAPDKNSEISVALIDNELGGHNGIDVCANLSSDFKKILLTGECDKRNAIHALNSKIINLYIEKFDLSGNDDSANLINEILKQIDSFSDLYFIESNFYNNSLLSSPVFKNLFGSVINEFNIIEYYLFEKDTFLMVDSKNSELLFKCWQDADFNDYYKIHSEDLEHVKRINLGNSMFNKQIPLGQNFIDSIKFGEFYYGINNI